MLNKRLERRLRQERVGAQAYVDDTLRRADEARSRGDWPEYFARSFLASFPATLWVLEQYDAARFYFRLEAERRIEQWSWYEANDPSFLRYMDPLDETELYLRAGLLDRAREFLDRALPLEAKRQQPNNLRLQRLALAAAQIGRADLAYLAEDASRIYAADFRRYREPARRAAVLLLEIGPAIVAYLLGKHDDCRERIDKVLEAEAVVRSRHIRLLHYLDHETGISLEFAKAHGLYHALRLVDPRYRHLETFELALHYFERAIGRAMLLGNLHWEGYQLRLYARLARDLFEGRTPEPNPFATDALLAEDPRSVT